MNRSTIMARVGRDDFEALQIASAMESAGAIVISIVYVAPGAQQRHGWHVFARVPVTGAQTIGDAIANVDDAISEAR